MSWLENSIPPNLVTPPPPPRKGGSLYARIADGNPATIAKAQQFLELNGEPRAVYRDDLAFKLAKIVATKGEAVLPQIAEMHPDYEFIVNNIKPVYPVYHNDIGAAKLGDSMFKNDCGCQKHSDTGIAEPRLAQFQLPAIASPTSLDIKDLAALMMLSVTTLAVFALIFKSLSSNGK
jgi:hypothetical protein